MQIPFSEMKRPMVSVVMLTYNSARTLPDAIKGVVHQKAPFDIELIISDDASTDCTLDVARQWQEKYPGIIRIISNTSNLGLQKNYLKAIKNCNGKYLTMCDADDYWISAKKLAIQAGYMEEHPDCNITFHRVINHYTDTGAKSLSNGHQKADTTILDLSKSNFITNLSVMYRFNGGNAVELPEWLERTHIPDYALHLLFANSGKIHYFSKPMGVYRKHSKGVWSLANPVRSLMMGVEERKMLLKHFEDRTDITEGLLSLCNRSLVKAACISQESGNDITEFISTYQELNPGKTQNDFINQLNTFKNKPSRNSNDRIIRLRQTIRNILTRLIPVPGPC